MVPCRGSSWLKIPMIGTRIMMIFAMAYGDSHATRMDEYLQSTLRTTSNDILFHIHLLLSFLMFPFCVLRRGEQIHKAGVVLREVPSVTP